MQYEKRLNLTYKPEISKTSKLMTNYRKDGYLEPQKTPDKRLGHENDFFHPKINKISQQYRPESPNVYERLYTPSKNNDSISKSDISKKNIIYEVCPISEDPIVNIVIYEPEYSFILKAALSTKTN